MLRAKKSGAMGNIRERNNGADVLLVLKKTSTVHALSLFPRMSHVCQCRLRHRLRHA